MCRDEPDMAETTVDGGAQKADIDSERLAAVIVEMRRTLRRVAVPPPEGPRAGPSPLSGAEQEVMRFLHSHPGSGTSAIAAGLRLRANTVSGVCGQLVRSGYLERTRDPVDGRAARFLPTEAARRRRGMRNERRGETLTRALAHLTGQERQSILDAVPALERLTVALDQLVVVGD